MVSNLFALAPQELTGSAFWAWVLQHACPETPPPSPDVGALAVRVLERMNVAPDKIFRVQTEVPCGDGRADIVLYDRQERPLAIVENKVWSTPYVNDIARQLDAYARNLGNTPRKVAMSWRYETECMWQHNSHGPDIFLSLPDQCNLLQGTQHPFVREYLVHASAVLNNREQRLSHIHPDAILQNIAQQAEGKELLGTDDAQWKLMTLLTALLPGKVNVYNGTSRGTPWTQAEFSARNDRDGACEFFYRMDRSRNGFYLRLNYYTAGKNEAGKPEVMQALRSLPLPPGLNPEWSCTYPRARESTLWYLWLKDLPVTVSTLQARLAEWHAAFIRSAGAVFPA